MNKFIIALAATTAIAAAAPAAAQYGVRANTNIQLRTDQLQTQLQAGVQDGSITRAEAEPLRAQLRALTQLERQYSRNGLTGQERSDLQNRMRSLRQGIRLAIRNGDGRYSQNDGYDRDDRYGDNRYGNTQMMDRNRDGYDDRDLNRDRRIDDREWRMAEERYGNNDRYDRDDDRYGRDDDRDYDDRYQNNGTQQRGGIGGLIDNVLGGGGLRVGQRVSGNLGGVPYQYRDQFRDGNGVYYRSDNRAIYQIDARTDTVVRVYPLNR
jgi:hypothetical protein